MQGKSAPGAALHQQQQSWFVVVLWPLFAGLVPPKISFNHTEMIYS